MQEELLIEVKKLIVAVTQLLSTLDVELPPADMQQPVPLRVLLNSDPDGVAITRELITMSAIGSNGVILGDDVRAAHMQAVKAGVPYKQERGGATRSVAEMKADLIRDAALRAGGLGSSTWGDYAGLHALPWE